MPELPPEEADALDLKVKTHLKIAEKVRTGEYFREALSMYNVTINDPMSERFFYIAITACAIVIFLFAYMAVDGLYPLSTSEPLIYMTHDIIDDMPHLVSLRANKDDRPSDAMLRFLIKNYVTMREEYDIATFDRNLNGVKSQTAENNFRKYQEFVDPHNTESPIALYQRHSTRKIKIIRTRKYNDTMEVTFEAIVDGQNDVKKSQWRANVTFVYSGIEPEDKSGKVTPVQFMVTDYYSKRLQDIK